ncbi:MAG: DUF2065 domain-containing protein [Gammaproteobacteria bacterium]|nr:DUF2065 domain-containing protein [Gammaproteobacteria bacterium]
MRKKIIDIFELIVLIFAFILILEGLLPLISPQAFKDFLKYFIDLSDNTIRIIGGSLILLGLFLYVIVT